MLVVGFHKVAGGVSGYLVGDYSLVGHLHVPLAEHALQHHPAFALGDLLTYLKAKLFEV